MIIKVTVCQLRNEPEALNQDWERLVAHVKAENSQIVVLPEMPFFRWFSAQRTYAPAVWQQAVEAHDRWLERLPDLTPAVVIGSRPVNQGNKRLNEGFVWHQRDDYCAVHYKYYLPDEDGYWEASWYERGDGEFTPCQLDNLKFGMLICTELWFMERARAYSKQGVHFIVTPRVTPAATLDKWLAGGRTCAVVAGAFTLSSNIFEPNEPIASPGGQGWIIDPEGQVLDVTSSEQPFLTRTINLKEAEQAKQTYPRYVQD